MTTFLEPKVIAEIDNDADLLRREIEILNAALDRAEDRLAGRESENRTLHNKIAGLEHALGRARLIEESAKAKTKEVKASRHELLTELRATRADLAVANVRITKLEAS